MKHNYFLIVALVFINAIISAQSYAPPAGQPGSTAISKADATLIAWAKLATVERGFINILNESQGKATVGNVDNVVGPANGSVMSLGDGGVVTLTFNTPITNGPGFDLAVFERCYCRSWSWALLAVGRVASPGSHQVSLLL